MRAVGFFILVLAIFLVAVSAWLGWVVVIAVVLGVLGIFLARYMLRAPTSAAWRDISAPVRVARGEKAELCIGVSITEGSHVAWVSAVDRLGADRIFLDSGGESDLRWRIDTSRRGKFEIGPTQLEVADPFGVYRRVLCEREQTSVLVVPRVHPVGSSALHVSSDNESGAERAGGDTFESIREYVVGDPQKHVHWKASARAGKLMVRRMVDTTLPWMLVVLDVNAKAYDRSGSLFDDFDPESFEHAVEVAASWAWHGCGTQQRVLLTTTSNAGAAALEVTARNRESALDWLALVEPGVSPDCGAARIRALIGRHAISHAVLVTGSQHAVASPWLNHIARRVNATLMAGAA